MIGYRGRILCFFFLFALVGCSAERRAQRQINIAEKHLRKANEILPGIVERFNDTTRVHDTIFVRDTIQVNLPGADTSFFLPKNEAAHIMIGADTLYLLRIGGDFFKLNFNPRPIHVVIDTAYIIDTTYIREKVGINSPARNWPGKNIWLVLVLIGIIAILVLLLGVAIGR